MSSAVEILKKYWNHDAFRTPQEQIIASVVARNDTFGLLPTGGGKSICFQIPALMMEGICIVISPLVALMKDQVQNLQNKGIKAVALTGGIYENDIIDILDNCQFGNYKFLYLSPERLQNDWIVERIKNLPVNLIAIDEAHCISQWGHDFRPAYLKIVKLKEYFPKVPFIALTASATQRVQDDIVLQLQLKEPKFFTKSFARDNLAYMVFEVEDKLFLMEQILKKNPQPSIVYVNTRKSCTDIVKQLESLGFSATFYHGGLSSKDKENHMKIWMEEKAQVMVATNAFGMGIDKANVKSVIHMNLPQNIENYYQEAGRAGRNGEKAFAVLLVHPSDTMNAEAQFLSNLTDKEFLTQVYKKLSAYFQIAYGEGIDEQFSFNMNQFCVKYNFPPTKTYNALLFLDRQGIITLSQEFTEKITIQFLIPSKEVIRYISLNPNHEEILMTILRTYPGVYEMPTNINLPLIAKKSNSDEKKIEQLFENLKEKDIIMYSSKNNDSTITFNEVREDEKTINRVAKYLEAQNQLKKNQLKSVLYYIKEQQQCKSQLLLRYFGENKPEHCGICSYCITLKQRVENKTIAEKITQLLSKSDLSSREIQKQLKYPPDDIIFALQDLLENNRVVVGLTNLYSLKK